jgi:Icc-related predicted phosphoesterase
MWLTSGSVVLKSMKVLSLSDKEVSFIYGPQVRSRFEDIDIIIGCGDLSYYYLEYILSVLDKPLFFVRGNHDKVAEYCGKLMRTRPHGAIDLHRRVVNYRGLLLAGVEGSLRYRPGKYQYSQSEMWNYVFQLVPSLIVNKAKYGKYLDVFVSHAPPESIHDDDDLPHRGIKAFRWMLKVFRPAYHFHGHIHIYRPDTIYKSKFGRTTIINTYPYRDVDIAADGNWN